MRQSVKELIVEKMMVIKFARKCREIDRQYEFNNNGDLDNGVYHKFVNNTNGENEEDDSENKSKIEDIDLLAKPMLVSSRLMDKEEDGIYERDSFEEEFKNFKNMEKNQERARQVHEKSVIKDELIKNRNQGMDLDEELVKTYETYQDKFKVNFDKEKIGKLVGFGYPKEFIIKSLKENDPNYCTAGYYLMLMDQNYC